MNSEIKTFINGMEKAGRLAAEALQKLGQMVKSGVTTDELDKAGYDFLMSRGAKPAPLNYHGFPKSICTSVNEVICHGVPSSQKLKEGDIINIDVTSLLDGYHGDTSATFFVGKVSEAAQRITLAAQEAMFKGIEAIEPGATTGDIGFAINKHATKKGFYVVRDIGGHGIGKIFHDEPFVPSYGKKGKGEPLKLWRCITVEPMINETNAPMIEHDIPNSSHKWYATADKCLSAQFEHTVLITDSGYQIMTQL
ncbi:MAG: type I methionyl aminopeptidase [Bdellovibrionales bacterium]